LSNDKGKGKKGKKRRRQAKAGSQPASPSDAPVAETPIPSSGLRGVTWDAPRNMFKATYWSPSQKRTFAIPNGRDADPVVVGARRALFIRKRIAAKEAANESPKKQKIGGDGSETAVVEPGHQAQPSRPKSPAKPAAEPLQVASTSQVTPPPTPPFSAPASPCGIDGQAALSAAGQKGPVVLEPASVMNCFFYIRNETYRMDEDLDCDVMYTENHVGRVTGKEGHMFVATWLVPQERNSGLFHVVRSAADEQTCWLTSEKIIRAGLVTMGKYSRRLRGYELQSAIPGFYHDEFPANEDDDLPVDEEAKDGTSVQEPASSQSSPSSPVHDKGSSAAIDDSNDVVQTVEQIVEQHGRGVDMSCSGGATDADATDLSIVDYVRRPGKGVWVFDPSNPNSKFTVWKTWQAGKSQTGFGSPNWWEKRRCQGLFKCQACEWEYPPQCSPSANAALKAMFGAGRLQCANVGEGEKVHEVLYVTCEVEEHRCMIDGKLQLTVSDDYKHPEPPKQPMVPTVKTHTIARFSKTKITGRALNVQHPELGHLDPAFDDSNKLSRALRAQSNKEWPDGRSFEALASLNERLGEEFLVYKSDRIYCYQTKWMKEMVNKAGDPSDHEVLPWSTGDVTYGLIRTDPDGVKWYTMISWFINIKVGSAFPGFISHIKGVDQISYQLHFKVMADENPGLVDDDAQRRFKIYFMQDYDTAQSLGLQRAAGEVSMKLDVGINLENGILIGATPSSSRRTRAENKKKEISAGEYIEELLKGCEFHFLQSVVLVGRYPSMVPVVKRALWRALTTTLQEVLDEVAYNKCRRKILRHFPNTIAWLTWWTRPRIAKMIFKSKMPKDLVNAGLDTNNHAESGNRDLKRALLLNLPIAAAAAELFKYCKHAEREYVNVRTGRVRAKKCQYRGKNAQYPSDTCPDKV
jgi:hypothetical protein